MKMRTASRGQGRWTVPAPTSAIDQFWDDFSGTEDPVMSAVCTIVERHADPDSIMVDIGAWIGPVSLLASTMYRHVMAVEPNPTAFQILNQTINHLDNNLGGRITPFQFAIERDDGTVKMVPPIDFYPLADLEYEASVVSQAISMSRFMTLVDLCDKPIGLIKADLGTLFVLTRTAGSLIETAVERGCPLVMSVSHAHFMRFEFDCLVEFAESFVDGKPWTVTTSGDDWSNLIEVCPL